MSMRANPMLGRQNRVRAFPLASLAVATLAAGMFMTGRPVSLHAQQAASPAGEVPREAGSGRAGSSGGRAPLTGYTIAPGDLLNVYVVAVPELSRSYRVGPSGQITLPMLNHPLDARGLTPDGLAGAISRALRRQGLISHPDVLVRVESSPRNSVAVTGSVAKPGVYTIFGPTTIFALLSRAGGLLPAAGSTAIVVRGPKAMRWLKASASNRSHPRRIPRIVKVPIRHLLDTGDEAQDVHLYPGDAVNVPRAGVVYVVGAVHRAGGFALTGEQKELTVLQAIALAGNVTRTAMLKDAVIIRRSPQNSSVRGQARVNLKKILSGKTPDRALAAGDILFVPDSTGKQVLARALAAATSVVIYRAPL